MEWVGIKPVYMLAKGRPPAAPATEYLIAIRHFGAKRMLTIRKDVSIIMTVVGLVLVVSISTNPRAEPGPIGRWLMNEPLTLWDRGMMRAQEVADRAGKQVVREVGARGFAVANYNWENNEINFSLFVFGFHGKLSHDICNQTRRSFISKLAGYSIKQNAERVRKEIPELVSRWFSHIGFESKSRDKKLGEKMARIIFVGVFLNGKQKSIMCKERIRSFDAPSKPL